MSFRIHDIAPNNMLLGNTIAQLNYLTTGLVYEKKIPVTHIMTLPRKVDVDIEHYCDFRDYPEVCSVCFEHHVELARQMDEDRYRDG